MTVARAPFVGTHLENAAQWLLEIEAMATGGWKLKRVPVVRIERKKPRQAERRAPRPIVGPTRVRRAELFIRIAEPRAAPRPSDSIRHHHFEQKTILASAKRTVGVAGARAAYCEGFNARDALIAGEVRATNEAAYAEGHSSTEAERVVYVTATNGLTYDDRMRFWELANENAHFVGQHTISVTTKSMESSWDSACRDGTMPDVLRQAIAASKATPNGSATVAVNDAGVVKRWLAKRTRSFPAELREHVSYEAPHNGRVGYSVVGQFPHDMSLSGMRHCLDGLVSEFTRRKIPCQAVIHEPTRKNSRKNWHFHLLYYAGPAEQMGNGRWSFERETVRDRWRTNKSVPLKRMSRDPEVAAADWVPNLKRKWAEIVNAQAIAEGIETRFTNDTNKKRGLSRAQTRYTPALQALRRQGVFSDADVLNNIDSWLAWEKRKRAILKKYFRDTKDSVQRLRADSGRQELPSKARTQIDAQLTDCERALRELDRSIDVAVRAARLREMMASGPHDVLEYYGGVVVALAKMRATPARTEKMAFAHNVCAAARAHLREIQPTLDTLLEVRKAATGRLEEIRQNLRVTVPNLAKQVAVASQIERDARAAAPHMGTNVSSATQTAMAPRSRQALAAHIASGRGLGG